MLDSERSEVRVGNEVAAYTRLGEQASEYIGMALRRRGRPG